MIRRSALCLLAAFAAGAFVPGDAAAQYGGGAGGGYYGGGGGYHSDGPPRRERQGQRAGGQKSNGPQCYMKRSKGKNGQWQSERVCD